MTFQITGRHHPAEGPRGGRDGLQAAQRPSLPTGIRNPAHLVHLHTATRSPHHLPQPLLGVPGRGLERGPEFLRLPSQDGRAEGDAVQVQGGGDFGEQIFHIQDSSVKHSLSLFDAVRVHSLL